jgi:hypothetical protein
LNHISLVRCCAGAVAMSITLFLPTVRASFSVHRGSALPASQTTTQELISALRDVRLRETDPDRVIEAINQLGAMRAIKAVNDLTNLLTFKASFWWEHGDPTVINEIHLVSTAERYPAVGALVKIGEPALPALSRVIQTNDTNSLETSNASWCVVQLFRDNLPGAVAYLRSEEARARSSIARTRLRNAANKEEAFQKGLSQ